RSSIRPRITARVWLRSERSGSRILSGGEGWGHNILPLPLREGLRGGVIAVPKSPTAHRLAPSPHPPPSRGGGVPITISVPQIGSQVYTSRVRSSGVKLFFTAGSQCSASFSGV